MKKFRNVLNEFYDNKLEEGIFTSENEDGENMIVEITNEYLKTSTAQSNGWLRVKYYYKDHTIEETYEK